MSVEPGKSRVIWTAMIVNRPGRKAGITMDGEMSAKGAAQWKPYVSHLRRSILTRVYLNFAVLSGR
jgi:hypothetical protein